MFVGRESELTKLEKMYSTNEFQFAVIYGRRRVGKTTLIREFLKNKELDSRVLTVLNSRKDIFKYKNKSLMAFSNSGFTEDAIEYAKNNDIRLVSFEMM